VLFSDPPTGKLTELLSVTSACAFRYLAEYEFGWKLGDINVLFCRSDLFTFRNTQTSNLQTLEDY
jgi:hypothetical protein